MKVLGIILVIAGILMLAFNGINFQKKENIAKIGPIEINKNENKHIGWPVYTGIIVGIAGIGFILVSGKK